MINLKTKTTKKTQEKQQQKEKNQLKELSSFIIDLLDSLLFNL